jgi:hypothetical protein
MWRSAKGAAPIEDKWSSGGCVVFVVEQKLQRRQQQIITLRHWTLAVGKSLLLHTLVHSVQEEKLQYCVLQWFIVSCSDFCRNRSVQLRSVVGCLQPDSGGELWGFGRSWESQLICFLCRKRWLHHQTNRGIYICSQEIGTNAKWYQIGRHNKVLLYFVQDNTN